MHPTNVQIGSSNGRSFEMCSSRSFMTDCSPKTKCHSGSMSSIQSNVARSTKISKCFRHATQHIFVVRTRTLHLLRLLQFAHPEKILEKMYAISELSTNHNDAWTLEGKELYRTAAATLPLFPELLFAFDNTDETTTRLYMDNEHMKSFDRQWLCSHVF